MKKCMILLSVAGFLALASGCASSSSGKVYSRDQARTAQTVSYGVIVALEDVMIEGTKSPVGAIAGGVLGGVLGNTIGGGSGKTVATAAGAVGGAAAGAAAEEGLTRQKAYALTIRLDNGQEINFAQAKGGEVFNVGQRVQVLRDGAGTTRARPTTETATPAMPTPAAAPVVPATPVATPPAPAE